MSKTSTEVGPTRPNKGAFDRAKGLQQEGHRILERARARWSAVDVVTRTFTRYSEDDTGSYAAALTYYTFFALFPLLLFAGAAVGYLTFGNEDLAADFIKNGVNSIPLIRDALSEDGLAFLQKNKDAIVGTGLILALYAGSGMIVALEHALNKIHHVTEEGNWFQKRGRALGWLAILGIAGIGSMAMTGFAEATGAIVGSVLGYVGGFAVNLFIFSTAFKVLPATKLTWRDIIVGAVVAAVGFELLKSFGAAYLARGDSARNDTYGALAASATLLVASYLICQVTLLAAEVNATLIERRTTRTKASDRSEEI